MIPPPVAVLTDIEGTTTPIAFVHDVLFPYARRHMATFIRDNATRADVASALHETQRLVPTAAPLATLFGWMDADAKIGPLKTLQGLIWAKGYARGELRGEIYPDVAPALQHWHDAGVQLHVYSSGSVAAQRLLFRYTTDGDLESLFSGFFDTAMGNKREAASYGAIADVLGSPAGAILFLSDVSQELNAAAAAGMRTCQIVRQDDGTMPSPTHPIARNFAAASAMMSLPALS